MKNKPLKKPDVDWILLAITLFEATAFLLLAFYKGFDFVPLVLAVSVPLLLVAQVLLLGKAFPHLDRYMLIIANFLCGIGLIVLYRLSPEKALRQLLFYGVGVTAMVVMTGLVARFRHWRLLRLPIMFARCAAACRQNRCSPPSAVIKDALAGTPGLCLGPDARRALLELGMALGKFDMEGQCRAIGLAEARLQRELELLGQSRRARCRSYETIGVCAGLAIAVLLV